jgi:hypothetical protein
MAYHPLGIKKGAQGFELLPWQAALGKQHRGPGCLGLIHRQGKLTILQPLALGINAGLAENAHHFIGFTFGETGINLALASGQRSRKAANQHKTHQPVPQQGGEVTAKHGKALHYC